MPTEEIYKGYVISSYTNEVDTDQQGRIILTRWRVSVPVGGSTEVKRIIRDNITTIEQARIFVDQKGH